MCTYDTCPAGARELRCLRWVSVCRYHGGGRTACDSDGLSCCIGADAGAAPLAAPFFLELRRSFPGTVAVHAALDLLVTTADVAAARHWAAFHARGRPDSFDPGTASVAEQDGVSGQG